MSAATWGIIFIVFIIIALIITIVVLNRGNNVDVITTLPSFRILYPKTNTYLGLLNVPLPPDINTRYYSAASPVYQPVVNSALEPDLGRWTLVEPTTTTFMPTLLPNEKLYKLANTVYSQIGIRYFPQNSGGTGPALPPAPSQIGYIGISLSPIVINNVNAFRLQPFRSPTDADIFIYTDLENNQFTLRALTGNSYVGMDANNIALFTNNSAVGSIATFQLVPINDVNNASV